MIIAIDFDGTVVDHRYPAIGPDAPLAVEVLKELVRRGNKLILYTMRSAYRLGEAIAWFQTRGIPLMGNSVQSRAGGMVPEQQVLCPALHR
jgi:hydroxymethylpyrimidine pyrophosphatase-like HAD family hydrolase